MKVSAAEWFESIMKMCKVMESLGWTYTAEGPASAEKISEFEKETGCQIPDEYKELMNTRNGLALLRHLQLMIVISVCICLKKQEKTKRDSE